MQDLPAHPIPVRQNVMPWPGTPTAIGTTYSAQTDRGNNVIVWRPDVGLPASYRYWCHGHATLCYWIHNYTIFSGHEMETVLDDEWFRIDKKPNVGDIIVFRATRTTTDYNAGEILHTARIEHSIQSWGVRTAIRLSSKNGADRLQLDVSPEQVLRVYNMTRWYHIEESCCSTTRINKQYYRRRAGVGRGPFRRTDYDPGRYL
jgi:hypothetical protein